MINLELPKHLDDLQTMMRAVAKDLLRPISRKYDKHEHAVPEELAVIDRRKTRGLAQGKKKDKDKDGGVRNGTAMASVITIEQMCWGDVGLMLSVNVAVGVPDVNLAKLDE